MVHHILEVSPLSLKYEKHEILQSLKNVHAKLGHAPSRREYDHHRGAGPHSEVIYRVFGGFTTALQAAGIAHDVIHSKDKQKFKYKETKFESFTFHNLDLTKLFEEKGNPNFIHGIFMPDTHVRHRDKDAVSVFLQCLQIADPDIFVIMGDFLDAWGISHWPNDEMESKRFVPECLEARELLEQIIEANPSAIRRIYLEGNHEDWIRQAMVSKMPELFDGLETLVDAPNLENVLALPKFGFDLIPLNHFLKIGKAYFTHGFATGTNHPAKHLKKVKGNIYYGHIHDDHFVIESGIEGTHEAASLACLCKLDAPFMKGQPTNWRHGFGEFWFFPDGTYIRRQHRIENGKCFFQGKLITA
jgi:hypothetical protein